MGQSEPDFANRPMWAGFEQGPELYRLLFHQLPYDSKEE